jgi:predicted DCC family thiol-disulfide oxidoreductase YuxK
LESKVLELVYDTECPACDIYCKLVRVRDSVGELVLVDARDNPEIMQDITARGWDIDEGMVLRIENQLYYGSEAIHVLSMLGTRSGIFNRLNYWLFRSPSRAKILYPFLRACRGMLLKLLRKTRINNLRVQGRDRF